MTVALVKYSKDSFIVKNLDHEMVNWQMNALVLNFMLTPNATNSLIHSWQYKFTVASYSIYLVYKSDFWKYGLSYSLKLWGSEEKVQYSSNNYLYWIVIFLLSFEIQGMQYLMGKLSVRW